MNQAMRVEDELLGNAGVEILVALWSFVQCDYRGVYYLCDWQTIMQNGLHELIVVLEHRCLTGEEAMRLGPTQADAHAQVAGPCGLFFGTWIFGDVEAGDADGSASAHDGHQ